MKVTRLRGHYLRLRLPRASLNSENSRKLQQLVPKRVDGSRVGCWTWFASHRSRAQGGQDLREVVDKVQVALSRIEADPAVGNGGCQMSGQRSGAGSGCPRPDKDPGLPGATASG